MYRLFLLIIAENWPDFHWDEATLRPKLDSVRLLQGRLLGRTEAAPEQADLEVEMDALIQNAIRTSEIEGEHLDVGSVRSSVARQLGLQRAGISGKPTPESDSLVELLLEATHQPDQPFSRKRLTVLNERQVKVLNRLLNSTKEEFEHGIHARKYQSLTKVSKATATRDLAELMDKGCLRRLPGGGRSTRYALAREG